MKDGYFDIAKDKQPPCFCHSCCVGKPADELSPDLRYCLSCYGFSLKEAEMNTSRRGNDWKPRLVTGGDTSPPNTAENALKGISTWGHNCVGAVCDRCGNYVHFKQHKQKRAETKAVTSRVDNAVSQ